VERPASAKQKAEPKKCPAGHTLILWNAKPGWCDGCGNKIKAGQAVMDCRKCNYYLCSSCAPQEDAEEPSFWGAVSSLGESWSSPAVDSAFDNVALRFGDVIDAAKQDMNDIATDISSFVASAIGFDEDEEDIGPGQESRKQAEVVKKTLEKASPRSRQEAVAVLSDFCEKYPASRVRPNSADLEKLWGKVSTLKAAALISATYDQLSFANGDTSWQPRLRALYAIEFFFKRGGLGKEVAVGVYNQARSIIQHLVEVQQCADKAFEVTQLLTGKIKVADPGAEADDEGRGRAAKAKAEPKKEATPDLLDMADAVTCEPPASGSLDLLGASPVAKTSQDLDLFGSPPAVSVPVPAASSTTAATDVFNPNQPAAAPSAAFPAFDLMAPSTGMPSALRSAMPSAFPSALPSALPSAAPPSAGFGGVMGMPPMGQGFGAPADPFGGMAGLGSLSAIGAGMGPAGAFGSSSGFGGYGGATASMAGSTARQPPPALNMPAYDSNSPSKGMPYIPAPKDLTPVNSAAPQDPFAFVGDIVGDAKK